MTMGGAELRRAAFALLEQATAEFGWVPDAPRNKPVGDDRDCAITWGALHDLHAALESTPAQPVREIEIPAASNPRSACVGEDAGQGVGETISPAPAQPVREGQEGKAEAPHISKWQLADVINDLRPYAAKGAGSLRIDVSEIKQIIEWFDAIASQPDPADDLANCLSREVHYQRAIAEAESEMALKDDVIERAESENAGLREALAFIERQARNSRYGVTIELLTGQEGEAYGFRFGRQGYLGPPRDTAAEAIEAARSALANTAHRGQEEKGK